ncbi:MAG: cob(I)yrinic acid a,c-diamide adenosyltransferase [Methylotenera sp.]|nr:cob(I)yrinic acid a,c-diamide adenosyltransferase [Oligoflexia bacterium]
MKIYTKSGDSGQTGLFGGDRVPKDHLRIRSYGTLDELNSVLGIVLTDSTLADPLKNRLLRIQGELFQVGAELATPRGKEISIQLIEEVQVLSLETEIDEMEAKLEPLKTFILPGGSSGSAQLHFARTVSRRAERELVILHRAEPLRPVLLQYVNRLSDYFFVCARYANHTAGVKDVPWVSHHRTP